MDGGKHAAQRLELHVPVDQPGMAAPALLQQASDLSLQRIKHAMQLGAVWLTRGRKTQRLRRASRPLRAGDELHLYYDPEILAAVPPEPALIEDQGEYSVWDKPYGLRSQGSKWGDHCALVRLVERQLQRNSFTVHRLDRAASGLMLIAHSKTAAARLAEQFRERQIDKRYHVIVAGDRSEWRTPLRIAAALDGKSAVSHVRFLAHRAAGDESLLEVRIETGRKHQIRRHLSDLGHPVCGDRLYGRGAADGTDLRLRAVYLGLKCPVRGRPVRYDLR